MGTRFLREAKSTRAAGITIKPQWLERIVEQARCMGRTPILEIRLEGAKMFVPTDWVMLPADVLQEILDGSR